MNKKKIIIIVLAILLIIGSFIAIKIVLDFNKEAKLREEIKEISAIFTKMEDKNKLTEILDRRVVNNGQYAIVEDAIKLYYKDLYNNLSNLEFLLDDDNFTDYLSSKNLSNDGANFNKSRENLANSRVQIDEYYKLFTNLLDDDPTRAAYLEGKNIDIYYRNFYLELTTLVVNEDFRNTLKSDYERVINRISIYNEIFDFLLSNKGHWAISNDKIAFDDTVLYDDYIRITEKLNDKNVETTGNMDEEEVSES